MIKNRKEFLKEILKKKIYIVLIAIIFAITGVGYTITNVKYVSSKKILLDSSENENSLIDTYKELASSSTVLEKVLENLNLNISIQELNNMIEVKSINNTNMIEIRVLGENSEQIQLISKEISTVLKEKVDEIYKNKNLYEIDSTVNEVNTGNTVVIAVISGIVGFLIAILIFVTKILTDTKIKSSKDIELITGLNSLICIPNIKLIAKKKLNIKNIQAHNNEIFKKLMTNIQFLNTNNLKSKSILITSVMPWEGKTYVANNLAIEFAKAGKKVIIIDSDMRRGRIARIFNLPNDLGFSNYLSSLDSNGNVINERITRFINDTEIKNLSVITSGNIPPNPTELLRRTNKIEELIKDLKVFYDVIIFDGVAVLEAPESSILSKTADLSLLISSYRCTKKEDLLRAYDEMSSTEGSVIGTILNKIPERKGKRKVVKIKDKFLKRIVIAKNKLIEYLKFLGKILNIFLVIWTFFKLIFINITKGYNYIKNTGLKCISKAKNRACEFKEYFKKIKHRNEKIKLIEAGALSPEEIDKPESNVVKEVFDNKMSKFETSEEIQYRKKLDEIKFNIEEHSSVIEEKNESKVRVSTKQFKSKFDLIKEQQENSNVMDFQENEIKMEKNNSNINLNSKESVENVYGDKEVLTEEMIKQQVEMDDLLRMAELEEDEKIRMQNEKKEQKERKKLEKKEKINEFKTNFESYLKNIIVKLKERKQILEERNIQKIEQLKEEKNKKNEIKYEEKKKRENEKIENRERIAKVREEKRAYKELEKKKHKEEIRIREELQEDNLYPKPRM